MPPMSAMQQQPPPNTNSYYQPPAPMSYPNPPNSMYGMPPPSSTPQPGSQAPPNTALNGLPPNILALLQSAQQQQRPPPPAAPYGMPPPQGMMNSPPPLPNPSNNLQYQQLMSFLVSIFQNAVRPCLTFSSNRGAGNNDLGSGSTSDDYCYLQKSQRTDVLPLN